MPTREELRRQGEATRQRLFGAALELELSTEAVREVLVQAGLYAGFSAAEETLALLAEVLAERNLPFPPDPPADASLEELASRMCTASAAVRAMPHRTIR